jgi:hypothetical protein
MTGEREALIAAIEWRIEKETGEWPHDGFAERVLDAALSVRGTAPCPECGGTGAKDTHSTKVTGLSGTCYACDGSGSVDTGPLLLLASQLEQVGWGSITSEGERIWVADDPARYGPEVAAVYTPLYRPKSQGEPG